jgi:hypothetical protein
VTTGSHDVVTIDTDPSGAICRLTQGAKMAGVVNPTPGSIEVSKSMKDLTVKCELEGYLETEGTIESDFQAMTLGNVILGGLVGVAVDAASGAMSKYEANVKVTMIPASFKTEAERDEFFDRTREELLAQHDRAVKEIEKHCGDPSNCEEKLKKAEKERDSKLAYLEIKRQEVTISGLDDADSGIGGTGVSG